MNTEKPKLGLTSCGLNKKDGKVYSESTFNVETADGDVFQSIHEDIFNIEMQIRETEEEFAYAMISPFCERIVEKKLSKKELERILRRGMQQESKWIPANERQPKKSGYYWCTFGGGNVTGRDYYTTASDAQIFEDPGEHVGWRSGNVIAWMPMPEPYKPKEED